MAEGWICPRCQLVLAPHVNEHRCEPPAGVVASGPVVMPGGGGGGSGGGGLPWPGSTITVTGGTTTWRGGKL